MRGQGDVITSNLLRRVNLGLTARARSSLVARRGRQRSWQDHARRRALSWRALEAQPPWGVLAIWLLAALALAASGVFAVAAPPLFPLTVWTPVILVALAAWRVESVRERLLAIDTRWFVGYHVVRVGFGALFLWMHGRGELHADFAVPAGYGDLVAGGLALGALALVPVTSRLRWGLLLAWNLLAALDIVMVFVSAQRILFFGPGREALSGLLVFPLPILLPFVVPLILITHGCVFAQLWRLRGRV